MNHKQYINYNNLINTKIHHNGVSDNMHDMDLMKRSLFKLITYDDIKMLLAKYDLQCINEPEEYMATDEYIEIVSNLLNKYLSVCKILQDKWHYKNNIFTNTVNIMYRHDSSLNEFIVMLDKKLTSIATNMTVKISTEKHESDKVLMISIKVYDLQVTNISSSDYSDY